MYRPEPLPVVVEKLDPQVQRVIVWLEQQLWQLSGILQTMHLTDGVIFPVRHTAPGRNIEGLVVLADGTNWNPGAGAGLYIFRGGAWRKLD